MSIDQVFRSAYIHSGDAIADLLRKGEKLRGLNIEKEGYIQELSEIRGSHGRCEQALQDLHETTSNRITELTTENERIREASGLFQSLNRVSEGGQSGHLLSLDGGNKAKNQKEKSKRKI